MSDPATSRSDLTSRSIPHMTLSTGTPSSSTAPPPSMAQNVAREHRAMQRFAVEGTAIITGGGGTLALVAARALLEHGLSNLVLFDLNISQAVENEINKLRMDFRGAKFLCSRVDVTNAESLQKAVESVQIMFGDINILCCFAGVVGCTHAIDMSPEEWRRTLDINTTGAFLSAQAVARFMKPSPNPSSIIFIASISAHRINYPQPQCAYNASKAALLSLKSSLAAEWAVHGIRVNSISPGYMDTVLNAGEGLEEARQIWTSRCPMGRMGKPEELCGAVVFLCSRASSFVTGTDIIVDGGQVCF